MAWSTYAPPAQWVANWSEDGTDVTFPIAEADGDTGDMRKCIYALLAKFYAFWLTIPVADRPAMMTIYRSTSTNDVTGEITQTFQFQFKVTHTGTEVADEESA
jgi:hypothetical protein